MKIRIFGATDVGQKRDLNEDRYLVLEEEGLLLVCDGMGGHAAGEIASQVAAETIENVFQSDLEKITPILSEIDESFPQMAQRLIAAIRLANRRIYNMAVENASQKGMGTTIVALAITPDGLACIAHVGDSRVYRIRKEEIEPLTVDHSYLAELLQDGEISQEEAKDFGPKNVITRALGTKFAVRVDVRIEPAVDGDIYLLCSDGLTGQVEDEQILKTLLEAGGDLKLASQRLIQQANETGGLDNITVALLHTTEIPPVRPQQFDPLTQTLPEETPILQEAEDALLESFYSRSQKGRKPKGIFIGVTAAGLVLLAAVGFFLGRKPPSETPPVATPSFASLEVRTTPEGVILFLDGNPHPERTPTRIDSLEVGSRHDLRFELKGYLSERMSVEIPSGGILKTVELRPEVEVNVTYWDEKYDDTFLVIDGDRVGRLSELKGRSYALTRGSHTFDIVNSMGQSLFSWKDKSLSPGKKVAIVPDEPNPNLQFVIE
ncbi:Stp1/IreP family PP2C-type Ser/Thr phosphatase [candidate division TA06 bacterium]|nr:Stp1/IreP family PP2C-type Ser/Thr phosphatase [candidate division TA06 bacterium]